jgi:hypothetical protein
MTLKSEYFDPFNTNFSKLVNELDLGYLTWLLWPAEQKKLHTCCKVNTILNHEKELICSISFGTCELKLSDNIFEIKFDTR